MRGRREGKEKGRKRERYIDNNNNNKNIEREKSWRSIVLFLLSCKADQTHGPLGQETRSLED